MKHRFYLFLVFLAMPMPAHAHGIEALIMAALIYGIVFGFFGGIVNGAIHKEMVLGLIITVVLYFLTGLGLTTYDFITGEPIPNIPPRRFIENALSTAGLQIYGGVVPLAISFLATHFIFRYVRGRIQ